MPPTNHRFVTIAKSWGWSNPTSEVLKVAQLSDEYKNLRSGDALKKLNIITPKEVEQLLLQKPADIKLLEYLASKNTNFRPHIDKILTLKNGLPFYDQLETIFELHPLMDEHKIHVACEALDAVLLTAENCPSVLIFSTYKQLLAYETAGRDSRAKDPIRQSLFSDESIHAKKVHLGLGPRDQIIKYFAKVSTFNDDEVIEESLVWKAESVTNPTQKIVVKLLDTCLINKASDLKFKPLRTGGATPMMRVNGDYIEMPTKHIKKADMTSILNFLMTKSGANIKNFRKFIPSDGQMSYESSSGEAFLRCSFIPLNHSDQSDQDIQSIAIRIFKKSEEAIDLHDLQLKTDIIDQISISSQFDNGLIILVGATGSGKSTTIAGAINENIKHFGEKRHRISIEQPVERYLPGLTQINIKDEVKKNNEIVDGFELNLRAIKRHDPDVIWVGEIRDAETANTCVGSATSGHLVYATLHANNTIVGYDTLLTKVSFDNRFQLIESLSLIVSQQLVKHVCKNCRDIEPPTPDEIRYFESIKSRLGLNSKEKIADDKSAKNTYELPKMVPHANPSGCDYVSKNGLEKCRNGFVGRLPVNEILVVTYEVKNAMISFLHTGNVEYKKVIEQSRESTMFESAFRLLNEGKIEVKSISI